MRVDDTSILPALTKQKEENLSQATTDASSQDALKIFKFVSDNSKVEWSILRYNLGQGEMFTLATFHNEDYSPGYPSLGIPLSTMKASVHSHPGIIPTLKWERSSIGDTSNGCGWDRSDWGDSIWRYNKTGKDQYLDYVYFPNSGNVYQVTPWKIIKIK